MKRILGLILILFCFSSCALIPAGTQVWIDQKMDKTPIGSSKETVLKNFGQPIYHIDFPEGIEIWGYELGHYWYHLEITFFFRDERVIGVPLTSYDQLRLLQQLRILDSSAQFYKASDSK